MQVVSQALPDSFGMPMDTFTGDGEEAIESVRFCLHEEKWDREFQAVSALRSQLSGYSPFRKMVRNWSATAGPLE